MDMYPAGLAVRAGSGPLVVAELRAAPLSVDECLAAVALPEAGGTALFVGTVRDHDGGKPVVELEYTAHPSARRQLAEVAREVADGVVPSSAAPWAESSSSQHRHDHAHEQAAPGASAGVLAVAVHHRTGLLAIGDLAVVVAASAAHRAEAFVACRLLIDEVKARVPIWKRQLFADGTSEWVGAC